MKSSFSHEITDYKFSDYFCDKILIHLVLNMLKILINENVTTEERIIGNGTVTHHLELNNGRFFTVGSIYLSSREL